MEVKMNGAKHYRGLQVAFTERWPSYRVTTIDTVYSFGCRTQQVCSMVDGS